MSLPALWPHQARALSMTDDAIKAGYRCICLASPTGSGKGRTLTEMAKAAESAVILTNRKMITRQSCVNLDNAGLDYGVVADGYEPKIAPVQLVSVQTALARKTRRMKRPPEAKLVIVDEAHNHAFDWIIDWYLTNTRATVVGFSATPLNLHKAYDKMCVAAVNSELFKAGVLVPCDVFSPDEPDMKGVKRNKIGEYDQQEAAARVMGGVDPTQYQWEVFGNVLHWWKQLNPFQMPTVLFAPGVKESKWFVDLFNDEGIASSHIDANTSDEERANIVAGSKDGRIKVVSSYGVLREGVDMPWLRHAILVQVCGALTTYLQVVGRILRAHPDKDSCILQEHAGSFHRHGSPNADRDWELGQTNQQAAKERQAALKSGELPEPIRCPECGGIRKGGPKCPHCGFEHSQSVRLVRMTDGKLKKVTGPVYGEKAKKSEDQRVWTNCLWACANSGRTVKQAAGMYYKKLGKWPSNVSPLPPKESLDWGRSIISVWPWIGTRRRKAS